MLPHYIFILDPPSASLAKMPVSRVTFRARGQALSRWVWMKYFSLASDVLRRIHNPHFLATSFLHRDFSLARGRFYLSCTHYICRWIVPTGFISFFLTVSLWFSSIIFSSHSGIHRSRIRHLLSSLNGTSDYWGLKKACNPYCSGLQDPELQFQRHPSILRGSLTRRAHAKISHQFQTLRLHGISRPGLSVGILTFIRH